MTEQIPTSLGDGGAVCDIIIQPDGQIFVHGLTREMLQLIQSLQPDDPHLVRLAAHLHNSSSVMKIENSEK